MQTIARCSSKIKWISFGIIHYDVISIVYVTSCCCLRVPTSLFIPVMATWCLDLLRVGEIMNSLYLYTCTHLFTNLLLKIKANLNWNYNTFPMHNTDRIYVWAAKKPCCKQENGDYIFFLLTSTKWAVYFSIIIIMFFVCIVSTIVTSYIQSHAEARVWPLVTFISLHLR